MIRGRWIGCSLLALMLIPVAAMGQHYIQTNLVSDVSGVAAHTDADLKNAWGVSHTATSPWWVSDNGTGLATLYNATGVKQGLIVTIAPPPGSTDPATPTGQVANGTTGFVVPKGATGTTPNGPARFIFATEDGTISGWNPTANGTHSLIGVDNSVNTVGAAHSAIYKGLAILTVGSTTRLYAANFKGGTIDVFDSTWQPVTSVSFVDSTLPPGYAPFNVQALGTSLFVAYAKVGVLPDEQHGKGLGFVDEFDSNGTLLRHFQHGPWLNAPWGMAIAPSKGFGQFSGALLVGNFGSGQLVAYDRTSGEFLGFVHGAKGPLVIDGLWAISFGAGGSNGLPTQLFFTAGPNDENDGLFGMLTAKPDDGDDE
jgi:uncharacterized protein (TIGR03118 family)